MITNGHLLVEWCNIFFAWSGRWPGSLCGAREGLMHYGIEALWEGMKRNVTGISGRDEFGDKNDGTGTAYKAVMAVTGNNIIRYKAVRGTCR